MVKLASGKVLVISKGWLKALKGSIKKWERIVNGSGVDKLQENCALCIYCEKHIDRGGSLSVCAGCPIQRYTGRGLCERTPWYRWYSYYFQQNTTIGQYAKVFDEKSKQLAQAELDFLKSLLPK